MYTKLLFLNSSASYSCFLMVFFLSKRSVRKLDTFDNIYTVYCEYEDLIAPTRPVQAQCCSQ